MLGARDENMHRRGVGGGREHCSRRLIAPNRRLKSQVLPGVFLCGEICDVFGRIGGFNFYWAWLSGRLAGISAAAGGRSQREENRPPHNPL